ncbi:MAG: carbohydrate ABC transporter permease [Chloroflexi bacterium]|nr:MAG: carbohydrate ABC transporter permease [Chloroflexota bacterium]
MKATNPSPRRYLHSLLLYALLLTASVVLILPLLWLVSTSLKEAGRELSLPPRFIPQPVVWGNYLELFRRAPFDIFFRNSFLITILSTLGSMLSCSLVGFGFARLRFRGRNWLFGLVLSTMMLPVIIQLIPQFLLFKQLGWLNTFLPLIVPSWFAQGSYGHGAFYIFLMRQFYKTIPLEFDEAARVDGANAFQIYWRVILPLTIPALVTVGIFAFLAAWSDFLYPLIFLSNKQQFTVALGVRSFMTTGGGQAALQWRLLAGASILSIIPSLIVLLMGQKYFVQGVALSGLSGR